MKSTIFAEGKGAVLADGLLELIDEDGEKINFSFEPSQSEYVKKRLAATKKIKINAYIARNKSFEIQNIVFTN